MKINLYDKELNRIAIIGYNYKSCLWSEGYNTIQNFTLELDNTTEYKSIVQPDFYVGRDDRETLMVITSVQVTATSIVASGKQASRVLGDVAFIGTIKSGSHVDTEIKNAYNNSTKIPKIEVEESDLGVSYNHQISNKSFSELCLSMCQSTDVGFTIVRKGSTGFLRFYKPEPKPNLVYAEKFGNLHIENLKISTETMKNYIIILGQGSGENRVRVDLDYSNGDRRKELVVDARDLQQEENETEEKYIARLADRGHEKFLENQKVFSCSFSPYADDFGKKYDIGDILTVYLTEYGMKLQARVSKFTQKAQKNSVSTTVEVGNIMIMR